ncbi:hypothetical protein QBC37DRAFT_117570 [Rhypophila decipiens]|uniref:N-acetyltransferase domain-containing protein n=1 Tax=Rhypophila decipiens TaxID=261697 RepID=A0AAN6XTN7_9PEZI|nr:hypothetical protein QBC37DRAFT_117570 [Rhypophila decipiens]
MASVTSKARIRIRDPTPADIPVIADIHFDAFGTNVAGKLLSPNGVTAEQKKRFAASLYPLPEPTIENGEMILKVVEIFPEGVSDDGAPGEVIAFAKWDLHRHPRTEEQWDVDIPMQTLETLGEGSNPEFHNAFLRGLHLKRKELAKGDPVLMLKILCTAPHRQRLGAGWALITWGTALADQLGIPTQLEASPPGYPLYKRAGYQPVGMHDLEVIKTFGGIREEGESFGENTVEDLGPLPEGVYRTSIMRRPARTKAE